MVPVTISRTISPDNRASRPNIRCNFFLSDTDFNHVIYAATYFSTSAGLSPSPVLPPIVPRIPEIDFINVILLYYFIMQS